MNLTSLVDGLGKRVDTLGTDPSVDAVTIDSRKVKQGVMFVACPGATATSKDGHDFVDAAIAQGASAIVVTRDDVAARLSARVPTIVVDDARAAAAVLAERACGSPSSRLKLVGVTGTNGKTTTTWIVAQLAAAAGKKAAVLGTLGTGPVDAYPDGVAWKSLGHTTPEAEVISAALAKLVVDGYDVVAMEVSSHALATKRVDGLHFAAAGFTNLTRDHLDFHGSMEAYFDAKARLFTDVAKSAPAIVPFADDGVAKLRAARPDSTTWSATDAKAALHVENATLDARGLRGELVDGAARAKFASPLIGAYNLENLVVAAGLARAIGISLADVAKGLDSAVAPPGRLERVTSSNAGETGPLVVVDYAHTPDALERALQTMRGVTSGKLFVVFGAGGDRDPGKRPIMGRIAAEIADAVVVTDDNPRSEDGDSIANAIACGIEETNRKKRVDAAELDVGCYAVERARRFAIRAAVDAARRAGSDAASNAVLVAGKGHERTQTIGARVVPFHDVAEARRALEDQSAPAFVDSALVIDALKSRNVRVVGAESLAKTFVGVSTDSRAVEPGSLFVALAGERFDAHDFVEASLQPGKAAAALVAREVKNAKPLVVVDDTLAALQDIARAYLRTLKGRRVALTGSNGKTTTKELIAACLRAVFGHAYVVATEGNLNNHIGVPLTALRCEPEHRALVFEMGMNHAREIATLADIVHPEVGLVTNIGTAHQGNFADGVEGVAKAKAELFEALPKDGVAVVNADDPRCIREAQRAAKCRHVTFGWASWADVKLENVVDRETGGQDVTLAHAGKSVDVALPLEGRHNAQNAAGAVAVGVALGLDFATCARGLADVHRAHGRLERFVLDGDVWLLDDTYNANPDSMEAALQSLVEIAGKRRKIIVLGEMRELGQFAETEHRHVGAGAGASGAHTIFACGALGKLYGEGAAAATRALDASKHAVSPQFVWTETNTDLAKLVVDGVRDGDVILVKGSRGARMEVVVDALMKARPRRRR